MNEGSWLQGKNLAKYSLVLGVQCGVLLMDVWIFRYNSSRWVLASKIVSVTLIIPFI